MTKFTFSAKNALIMGAGQNIGRRITQEWARRGARVAVADISGDAAEHTAGLIPTHDALWDRFTARANDPDAFIARQNEDYLRGDFGKPSISQDVIDSINA